MEKVKTLFNQFIVTGLLGIAGLSGALGVMTLMGKKNTQIAIILCLLFLIMTVAISAYGIIRTIKEENEKLLAIKS